MGIKGENTRDFDSGRLIETTYAATLRPEELEVFEDLWEIYLDTFIDNPERRPEDEQIDTHISLALDILKRVEYSNTSIASAQSIVDHDPGCTFAVDGNGAIIARNSNAAPLTNGRTAIWDLEFDTTTVGRVREWLANSVTGVDGPPLFVHTHLVGSERKHCLFFSPVVLAEADAGFVLVSQIDSDVSEAAVSPIQTTYDLSSAEADIAAKLANGMSPAEIADQRGASIHTVRTQIKTLLKKTDTNSVPAMVRVLAGISARLGRVSERSSPEDGKMLRKGSMTLADGRVLEILEQGHPRGYPVIWLHSLITDMGLTAQAAREAVLAGLRIITPVRAGFGGSDPHPQSTPDAALDACATDLREVLDHLGIDRTVIVSGWSSCFAQRFAIRFPETVAGILMLRGVPLWEDSYLEHIRPRYRNIVKSSIHLPRAVPYLAKVGRVLMHSGRELIFAMGMNRARQRDLDALKDPDILETVARTYRMISQQGVEAFVAELRTIHTDWSEDALRLRVPVSVLVEDDYQDFPEEAFRRYSELVPTARVRTISGSGEYLALTHFGVVIEEIRRLRAQPG